MRNNYVIYNHKSFLGYCLCASTKTTWTNGIYYPIESKSKMILIEGSLVVASYSCSSPPVDWFNMLLLLLLLLLLLCQITSKMIVMVTGSRFTSLHCSLSHSPVFSYFRVRVLFLIFVCYLLLLHALCCLTWLCFEPHIGHPNLSCFLAVSCFPCHTSLLFLMLSLSYFLALSQAFPDLLLTLLSFALSCDAWFSLEIKTKTPRFLIH